MSPGLVYQLEFTPFLTMPAPLQTQTPFPKPPLGTFPQPSHLGFLFCVYVVTDMD